MKTIPFFPYADLFKRDEAALTEVMLGVCRRGAYILQQECRDFDTSLAKFMGVKHAFGSDESMVIPFRLADFDDAFTEQTIASQPYKVRVNFWIDLAEIQIIIFSAYQISFHYLGGEKPILFGNYQNLAGDSSFTANYTFDGRGVVVVSTPNKLFIFVMCDKIRQGDVSWIEARVYL